MYYPLVNMRHLKCRLIFTVLWKTMRTETARKSTPVVRSYEETLKALNTLQSNAAYLQAATKDPSQKDLRKILDTEKYLLRSGITLEDFAKLSVIHVAGTKGKGSTCALTESILRKHGFRTGFFSSPHLVSVRERIRINGKPISEAQFSHYFWRVYKRLKDECEHESDMPTYFKFMTVLMIHVFLEANIDVAIIEVGIGGENDCTNIVKNPVCVGITSLAFDHTALLGNTIEEIAFQKSGIFKPNTVAFTGPQVPKALRVLEKRASERKCALHMTPRFEEYKWENLSPVRNVTNYVQQYNASLAIQLAMHWLRARMVGTDLYSTSFKNEINRISSSKLEPTNVVSMDKIAVGLSSCKWPGRMQMLRSAAADFFLDGAHTPESIENCVSWFRGKCAKSKARKIMIFNITGDRDPIQLLIPLKSLDFDRVYFVPNYSGVEKVDAIANIKQLDQQIIKCKEYSDWWGKGSVVSESAYQILEDIKNSSEIRTCNNSSKPQVLVTGSLMLVGAVLTILDPHLTMATKF